MTMGIWIIEKLSVSLFQKGIVNDKEMRPKKTHTAQGLELSQLYIGEDGLLSIWATQDELEIVGIGETIFGTAWICKTK